MNLTTINSIAEENIDKVEIGSLLHLMAAMEIVVIYLKPAMGWDLYDNYSIMLEVVKKLHKKFSHFSRFTMEGGSQNLGLFETDSA